MTLKKIKRVLQIVATAAAVGLVLIEKFESNRQVTSGPARRDA